MKKSIYDIADDYVAILAEIDDNDGVLTEDMEQRLQIAEDELEDKLRAYRNVIKQQSSFKDFNKEEIKRLRERNESFDKTKERLSNFIIPALHAFGNKTASGNYNLKYADFSVSTRVSESISINPDKVQKLLDMESGMIEKDTEGWTILKECLLEIDSLGGVDIHLCIPFSEVKKFRDDLIGDPSAGATWNISKKAIKEMIQERDTLYELISNNAADGYQHDRYLKITALLNYIGAEIIEKETVTFR